MALYKFTLDYSAYSKFSCEYSRYIYSSFYPQNNITINTSDERPKFYELLHSGGQNGKRAFKIKPLTPNFVIDEYLKKCWTMYHIKNEKKYSFWLPAATTSFFASLIFYVISFFWLFQNKSNEFPELWYLFAIPLGLATLYFCFTGWTMDDDAVKLSNQEKMALISPHISYSTNIAKMLKSINSYKTYNNGYSGGISDSNGGSSSSYTPPLVSHSEMDSLLKKLDADGTSWNDLANKFTLDEREKLFTKQLGSEEKGKFVNEKFEREDLSPARKRTLTKDIDAGEYEDASIKESLHDKVKALDGVMTNDDFQKISSEIKSFQERKRKIDAHTKYEGRLSNKDIKAIKEHLGYVCMACGLDPATEYGDDMIGIIEAHHKNPYSELEDGETREIKPDDFFIMCPTCHRLIHKLQKTNDLDGLKELLNKNKKFSWWS